MYGVCWNTAGKDISKKTALSFLKFAYEDLSFVFGYKADEPRPLTHDNGDFDKNELINRTSRFNR